MPYVRKYGRKKAASRRRRPFQRRSRRRTAAVKPMSGVPQSAQVKLRYVDEGTRTNAGATYASWRYRSSVYDPDPLLGSGAVGGFAEWAAFYNLYRVNAMRLTIRVQNMEAFPVQMTISPQNTDPGSDNSQTFVDAPWAKSVLLAPLGTTGSNRTVTMYVSGSKLIGDKTFRGSLNYSGPISGNPANSYFLNLGFNTPGIENFTSAGVIHSTQIVFYTSFFERVQLVA